MPRTQLRGVQVYNDTLTGAGLNDKLGFYDETDSYSAGDKVFWLGKTYRVKTGQSVTGGSSGDLTNSPDQNTTDWEEFPEYLYSNSELTSLLFEGSNEYATARASTADGSNIFEVRDSSDSQNFLIKDNGETTVSKLTIDALTNNNSSVLEFYNSNSVLQSYFTDEGRLIYGSPYNSSWLDGVDGALHLHEGKKIVMTDGANSLSEIYAEGKYIKINATDTSGGIYVDGRDIYFRNQAGTTTYMDYDSVRDYWQVHTDFKLNTGYEYCLGLGTFNRAAPVLGTYMSDNHEGVSLALKTNTGEQGKPTAYDEPTRVWISTLGNIGFNGTSEPDELFEIWQDETTYRRLSVAANGTDVSHDQYQSNFDFTKEFAVGDSITVNSESHTVDSITNYNTMTITPANTGSGSLAYTRVDNGLRFVIKRLNGYAGINVADPQERLDVSGNIQTDSAYYLGDSTISISKDIYDNLVFEDPNAGIKTLSELIPYETSPVTVGTGGNYTTIKAAIDAGKYNLVQVGNITETADFTIDKPFYIKGGDDSIINLAAIKITINISLDEHEDRVDGAVFDNCRFEYNRSGSSDGSITNIMGYDSRVRFIDCFIDNNSTGTDTYFYYDYSGEAGKTFFNGCRFNTGSASADGLLFFQRNEAYIEKCGFNNEGNTNLVESIFSGTEINSGLPLILNDCIFAGTGTQVAIWCQEAYNIEVRGSASVNLRVYKVAKNFRGSASCTIVNYNNVKIYDSYFAGFYNRPNGAYKNEFINCYIYEPTSSYISSAYGSEITFTNCVFPWEFYPKGVVNYNTPSSFKMMFNNCRFDAGISAIAPNTLMNGCLIDGTTAIQSNCTGAIINTSNFTDDVTIDGTNITISDSNIGSITSGTKTITVSSGADNAILTNCRTEDDISYQSDTVIVNNLLF
jgi:hypothetical protein